MYMQEIRGVKNAVVNTKNITEIYFTWYSLCHGENTCSLYTQVHIKQLEHINDYGVYSHPKVPGRMRKGYFSHQQT